MKVAGLEIKIDRTAYRAFFILGLIPFVVVGGYTAIFRTSELHMNTFIDALVVGVCFAVYHGTAQFVHQLGHALAARATGYPMTGIRYEYVFSYSEYPPNEPPLPDTVHNSALVGWRGRDYSAAGDRRFAVATSGCDGEWVDALVAQFSTVRFATAVHSVGSAHRWTAVSSE